MQAALKLQLLDAANQPYQIVGNFQYRMARGKLGGDRLFTYLLEHGVLRQSRRVMDLGCGRGLLLRIGNADGGWRFRFSQWIDLIVAHAHGVHLRRLYCRTHADWVQALQARSSTVTAQPNERGRVVCQRAAERQGARPHFRQVEFLRSIT
ncbi:hypothetical protein [Rhodoferax saidenbachensis]|uniref:Methyltransferase type 11 domain-containing protein n=1 Tax=Rhodoferax saidenbachensis TaxID=1484693 RepID=A0ABU1ZKM6_9BURK|nr:hypothetical protein [Rhodoferax saidenbachensis]MDR7306094.1 hypothetical protein [Rhodoferax saidenbachensis]